ncbi:MAG: hypothetical protein ACYTAS_17975, partial [Planctomycetota bacterium]
APEFEEVETARASGLFGLWLSCGVHGVQIPDAGAPPHPPTGGRPERRGQRPSRTAGATFDGAGLIPL